MHTFVIIIGPGMHMRFGASEGSCWQRKLKKICVLFCWNHSLLENNLLLKYLHVREISITIRENEETNDKLLQLTNHSIELNLTLSQKNLWIFYDVGKILENNLNHFIYTDTCSPCIYMKFSSYFAGAFTVVYVFSDKFEEILCNTGCVP